MTAITLDDIKLRMSTLGFKWQAFNYDAYKPGIFYKRIETKRPCLCNGRDQLVVWVFDRSALPGSPLAYKQLERYSLSVEITAEFKLGWTNLQVNGFSPDKFFRTHHEIEAALIRAWEAL